MPWKVSVGREELTRARMVFVSRVPDSWSNMAPVLCPKREGVRVYGGEGV